MKPQLVTQELHFIFPLFKTICSDIMSFLEIIVTIAILLEIILGTFANVFIVLVNCIDCIKRRTFSLPDRILIALAFFRIGVLSIILMNWCLTVFHLALSLQVRFSICVGWAVTNHFNTWLAAILSILYLLKIGNFSNLIFLVLKGKIKSVLIGVLLLSLVLLSPNLMMVNTSEITQAYRHRGNLTGKTKLTYFMNLTAMITFTLDNVIPFTISMICFLLLIYSLCKHLRTMKLYGKGSHDPSASAHIKALKAVISFLLLFSMFILSLIISGYNYTKSLNEPVHVICQAIGTLYPSSHSYILLWGNKRIKRAFVLAMIQMRARLCLKEQNP
ncbi:taste receptor type 2 member 136-like [Grammomys surdaster]|uniref:taste receptor type 2 member 136-like n=1 Tax=Grammomys surdaster TaxID=491861 RepID=UPI00109FCC5A|nr:taste receptor type 2 member 136-like [Grammomys surdaster]